MRCQFVMVGLLLMLIGPMSLWAQNIGEIKKGVVKLRATVDGKVRVGAGVIVKLDKGAAYLVTASHVIEGDPHPQVMFFSEPHRPLKAQVLGLEGGDPRGLAALRVEGPLPDDLQALALDQLTKIDGGETVMLIGFPLAEGNDWTVTPGTMSGRKGSALSFAGIADEGNSGGPVLFQGKVVGIVTQVGQKFNFAAPAMTARFAIEGWGVRLPDKIAQEEKSRTESTVQRKIESQEMSHDREFTGKDGAPMVLVPAESFMMGSPEGEGDTDEHPQHSVYLDAYYMDKFEVTVSRYAEFMQLTRRAKPVYWEQVDTRKHANLPVIGVNWDDAEAYCRWAGKRLPTEAEWEKGARGTDGRTYPWGNDAPTSTLANFNKGFVAEKVYDQGLAPVENYEAGKSPYGLHHMAGNVWEWTADWYDEHYYAKSPERNPKGPSSGQYRVLRGGSWSNEPQIVRSAYRLRYGPMNRYAYFGFRCAQDAR